MFSLPVVSDSLQLHALWHTRPPCLSPSPRVCPSSYPLHQWCHPAMSSSDALFSFWPQSFPASGASPVSCSLSQIAKILEFQLQRQSLQQIFRVDYPHDWLVWSPWCPRDSQESSPAPQFAGINSLAFCLLYGPALTVLHDHWQDHSLDYMDLCWQNNISAFQHTV